MTSQDFDEKEAMEYLTSIEPIDAVTKIIFTKGARWQHQQDRAEIERLNKRESNLIYLLKEYEAIIDKLTGALGEIAEASKLDPLSKIAKAALKARGCDV